MKHHKWEHDPVCEGSWDTCQKAKPHSVGKFINVDGKDDIDIRIAPQMTKSAFFGRMFMKHFTLIRRFQIL